MAAFFSRWKESADRRPPTYDDIVSARTRVQAALPITPLTHSPAISDLIGKEVYFKWDSKLPTGSFKERGAVNFLASLAEDERKQGICAASAGNHALAVSIHAARFNIPCTLVMPRSAPLVKVESSQRHGASVVLEGKDFDEAYDRALEIARQNRLVFVPAFDDHRIIAGQGTAGLEIMDQLESFDAVTIAIGGGGYISGISTAIREKRPDTFILGVQSEWAVQGRERMENRSAPLLEPGTIADGIAVKRTAPLTAGIIDKKVDQLVTVTESDIAQAVVKFLTLERSVVEGAGAAALAGLLIHGLPDEVNSVVVLVSGSNIDINVLSRLINRDLGERGRLIRMRVSVPDRPGSLAVVTELISRGGANVLETFHDRSFSRIPENVDITFLLEVRNSEHREQLIDRLRTSGIQVSEL